MFIYFFVWLPWISIFGDKIVLEILILLILLLLLCAFNIYLFLLYVFLLMCLFGFFLSILQIDMFCGFLYVIEFTAVFISLLLLFYLNIEGLVNFFELKIVRFVYLFSFFFFFNFFDLNIYIFFIFWNDYYENINNFILNDFFVLFLNFYNLNCFFLFLFSFFILFCSMICLILNRYIYTIKNMCHFLIKKLFLNLQKKINYRFVRFQNINVNHKQTFLIFLRKKWY